MFFLERLLPASPVPPSRADNFREDWPLVWGGGWYASHERDPYSPAAQCCQVGSVFLLHSLPRSEATGNGGQARGAAWRLLSDNTVVCICLFLRICSSPLALSWGPASSRVTLFLQFSLISGVSMSCRGGRDRDVE